MSAKRGPADDVIDLTLDSDDEQDAEQTTTGRAHRFNRNSKRSKTTHARLSSWAERNVHDHNDESDDDDGYDDDDDGYDDNDDYDGGDDDDDEIEVIDRDEFDKKPAAKPGPKSSFDDGIQVVDANVAVPTKSAVGPSPNNSSGDGELAVVGTRNEYRLPHLRQDCTVHPFTPNSSNRTNLQTKNAKHCDLCYCYGTSYSDGMFSLILCCAVRSQVVHSFCRCMFQCVMLLQRTAR